MTSLPDPTPSFGAFTWPELAQCCEYGATPALRRGAMDEIARRGPPDLSTWTWSELSCWRRDGPTPEMRLEAWQEMDRRRLQRQRDREYAAEVNGPPSLRMRAVVRRVKAGRSATPATARNRTTQRKTPQAQPTRRVFDGKAAAAGAEREDD